MVNVVIDKTSRPTHILLAIESRLIRNVIVAALEEDSDIRAVATVTTPEEALKVVQEGVVDVALVSTRLSDQGALKLPSAIPELALETKMPALGLIDEKKRIPRYVVAGVTGYILKDNSLEDMIKTGTHNRRFG